MKALPPVRLGDDKIWSWLLGGQTEQLSPGGYLGAAADYETARVIKNIEDIAFRVSEAILECIGKNILVELWVIEMDFAVFCCHELTQIGNSRHSERSASSRARSTQSRNLSRKWKVPRQKGEIPRPFDALRASFAPGARAFRSLGMTAIQGDTGIWN